MLHINTYQCKNPIVPEQGWFGQPKYNTPSKNHPTLCRFLLFYIFFIYMWSRLDHYWSNVYQQDHRSGCVLKNYSTRWDRLRWQPRVNPPRPRWQEAHRSPSGFQNPLPGVKREMTAALSAAKDLTEVRQNKEPPCASDQGFDIFICHVTQRHASR